MYNKNDPLVHSVKAIMEQNDIRRRVETKLCEELGIYSRNALPREHLANYDALLEQRIQEALHPNQQKLDVHEPEKDKLTAQDFKMLRAKKKPVQEEKHEKEDEEDEEEDEKGEKYEKVKQKQLDELSKKTLKSYVKKASQDVATKSAAVGRYAERANKEEDKRKKEGDYSGYRQGRKDSEFADKMFKKSWKRREGIAKAVDKLEEGEETREGGAVTRDGKAVVSPTAMRAGESSARRPPQEGPSASDRQALTNMIKKDVVKEEQLEEKKLTDAEMAEREKIVKSMKKGAKGFESRYGKRAKEVMYATATKQAKKLAEENADLDAVMEEIRANIGEEAFNVIFERIVNRTQTFDDGSTLTTSTGLRRDAPVQVSSTARLGGVRSGERGPTATNRVPLPQQGTEQRDALNSQLYRTQTSTPADTPAAPAAQPERQQAANLRDRAAAARTMRPTAQPADTVASADDRAAFRARTGSTVDSSTGQTQSNQPADTVASSADREAFRARTGSTVGASSTPSPAAARTTPAARPTPAPAARPAAAASTAAPEPKSKQMFQAAQDREDRGEAGGGAAFFAADKQRTAELRGMQENNSLTSTINKILKG